MSELFPKGAPHPEALRRFTQEDMLAKGLRVALGTLGPVGVVLGDFLTEFVPQQRMDRLQDFTEQLQARVGDLEEQFKLRLAEGGISVRVFRLLDFLSHQG